MPATTAPLYNAPILLGSSAGLRASSADQFARILEAQFLIRDLEPIGAPLERAPSFQMQFAAASLGEVGLTSVLGTSLTLTLDPRQPVSMLALPSHGWGRYQLDEANVDNTAGQTAAYLPAQGWQLTNDKTGGTGISFHSASLIRRLEAISGSEQNESNWRIALATPFVVPTNLPPYQGCYQQLISALFMIDSLYRSNSTPPDPRLCLDDLILRSIALLLHPKLAELGSHKQRDVNQHNLRLTVSNLMDWMQANLDHPISLSDIERQACYGRRAIQMGFKEAVGCGPMQWLRKQRLDRALAALQAPDSSTTVTSVSQACGYINLASFSRDFRDRFGIGARELLIASRRQQQIGHLRTSA